MNVNRIRPLSSKHCYAGQRVFYVMWAIQDEIDRYCRGDIESYMAWYSYRDGLSPVMWCSRVAHAYQNGTIMLAGLGKAHSVFSCELHALMWAYDAFCSENMDFCSARERKTVALGEASRVLRSLAEMEFGIHQSLRFGSESEVNCGR